MDWYTLPFHEVECRLATPGAVDESALWTLASRRDALYFGEAIVTHPACTEDVIFGMMWRIDQLPEYDDPDLEALCAALAESPWKWEPKVIRLQVDAGAVGGVYAEQATLEQFLYMVDRLDPELPDNPSWVALAKALTSERAAALGTKGLRPFTRHPWKYVRDLANLYKGKANKQENQT